MADQSKLACSINNRTQLLSLVKREADQLSFDHDISIVLNEVLLIEAFSCAEESLGFYGSNKLKNSVSFYKEAGHISYWINKLKPCRIETASDRVGAALRLGKIIPDMLRGRIADAEKGKVNDYDFQVNENIALRTGLKFILINQHHKIKQLSDPTLIHDFGAQAEALTARIYGPLYNDLINSFRYFNYSARAMAVLLEALTRTSHG